MFDWCFTIRWVSQIIIVVVHNKWSHNSKRWCVGRGKFARFLEDEKLLTFDNINLGRQK